MKKRYLMNSGVTFDNPRGSGEGTIFIGPYGEAMPEKGCLLQALGM